MPKLTGVSHVDLTVRDAGSSAAWYEQVLGMRRVAEHSEDNPATPGVRVTSISLMHPTGLNLNLIQHRSGDRESFSEFRVGLDHLSFAVESRDELERWVEHFQACGVGHSGISDQVYGSVDGEFRTSVLVFRDPDNIQLELFALV